MLYKDYKNTRDLVWNILINEKITELPIKVSALCRSLGIAVKYYEPTDSNSGEAQIVNGAPVIFVSRHEPIARQRFTAAHELGHIMLGHVGKYNLVNREPTVNDNPVEQAANIFASRLLAPACVLWGCGVKNAEDIERLCNISHAAAEYRMARMKILLERDKFLISPLERRVYEQFSEYISRNKL